MRYCASICHKTRRVEVDLYRKYCYKKENDQISQIATNFKMKLKSYQLDFLIFEYIIQLTSVYNFNFEVRKGRSAEYFVGSNRPVGILPVILEIDRHLSDTCELKLNIAWSDEVCGVF